MGYKIGSGKERKKKLEKKLKEFIPKLIELEAKKIILFGSLAKDSVSPFSDIDIIIVKKTDKKFLDRIEEIYIELNPGISLDLLVYTPEEFEELKNTNSFLKQALKEGKIFYEK